jgi:hypothetical protein
MGTQELYIRNATDTEARGPFTVQQLVDLAEAGQVTAETFVYDATAEQWVTIGSNAELLATVFPPKKKLGLKAKEIKTLNKEDEKAKPITVTDMLDAAHGRTDDTKDKADPQDAMMLAAKIGMIGAVASLVAAAASTLLPGADALMSFDADKLLAHPLALLGALDLVLAVLLGLGMSVLYPFIRFRAALGLGLGGFMLYAQSQPTALTALAVGSAGLYLCTVFVSRLPAILAAAAGVGGFGYLAWSTLAG